MSVASWYHCSVKVISRAAGRTAIAAAAYRAGAKLRDRQTEQLHDYTRRGGVIENFIVTPENAPAWSHNLEDLWNAAQEADHRKNSTMAREIELALPNSLDGTDREALVREFAHHLVERYGVAVSVALHEPSRHGDDRNYHAHLLMTTRQMKEDGLGKKTRELDGGRQEIKHIREYAATLINQYLEDAGLDERVDHRSYEERGIAQEPTRHLGPEASAMERRGEESRVGNENREIAEHNRQVDELVSELAAIDAEIAAEMETVFLPAAEEDAQEILVGQMEKPNQTWEEEKRAAQSTFKLFDYAFDNEESQSSRNEPSELSWEEQKQRAQGVFKLFEKEFQGEASEPEEAKRSGLTWEEQKRLAQRVFKDEDREGAGNQIDLAGVTGLSWEEQKREAQRVFKKSDRQITEIQSNQMEQIGLSWEEQMRAAQSAFKASERLFKGIEMPSGQSEQVGLSWEDQKREAQSAFNSPIVKYYSKVMQEKGEVREYGLGKSWYDRTVTMFENIYYGTMERIRDTWQRFVDRYVSPTQDQEIEPDQ